MPFELPSKIYNRRIPENNGESLALGKFLVARAAGNCNFVLNQVKFNRSLKKWMRKY